MMLTPPPWNVSFGRTKWKDSATSALSAIYWAPLGYINTIRPVVVALLLAILHLLRCVFSLVAVVSMLLLTTIVFVVLGFTGLLTLSPIKKEIRS